MFTLQQVAKRLLEDSNNLGPILVTDSKPTCTKNGCITSDYIKHLNCILSTSQWDSCFVTDNNKIVIVKSIKESADRLYEWPVMYSIWKQIFTLFHCPVAALEYI